MTAAPRRPSVPAPLPHELDEDQRRLAATILSGPRAGGSQPTPLTDADGRLVGPFGVFLHAPPFGEVLQELGARVRYAGSLPARLREIAVLTVAVETDCAFEWSVHSRVGREAGLAPDDLAALRSGADLADPTDRVVREAARHLCRSGAVDPAPAGDLVGLLGPAGAVELVTLVGYYRLIAQLMAVFGVEPPAGEAKEGPCTSGRQR